MGCGRPEIRELPPEASAPSTICADCGGRVVNFQYGLLDGDVQYTRIVQVSGGKEYWLACLGSEGFLVGGCVLKDPGWACISCGRVWPLFRQEAIDRR